ncbi:MAG: hypothetical protein K6B45_12155 [Bacteroidaceae bacterium]|nr:hypothetical protein [Bacteroidaceae bacterium]
MKKQIIFFKTSLMRAAVALFAGLLTFAEARADVVINEENFPDKNFRRWLSGQNYGADGVLTDEELSGITEMSVTNLSIQSLKGIEFFTALQYLWCYDNKLTSLDVSSCTALSVLSCFTNKLTSLDVSGCTSLRSLWCYKNKLASLDVSKNTALESLRCFENQLTSLDVSKNTALKELYCYCNQLQGTAMDGLIASLPNQENAEIYIYVKAYRVLGLSKPDGNVFTEDNVNAANAKGWTVLYYKDAKGWKEYNSGGAIVVINEENFPDENFRSYLLEQDYGADGVITGEELPDIKVINVYEHGIKSLKGIEFFKEMKQLFCAYNQISSLDVSGFPALQYLDCAYNQLTSLDVSGFTALGILWCDNNQLTSLDVSGCTALQLFHCNVNQLTSLDVSGCPALEQLYCYGNQLRGAAMNGLIASLPNQEGKNAKLYVYAEDYETAKLAEPDGNVCSKDNVAAAKAKGWSVGYYDKDYNWKEYAGDDGSRVDGIKTPEADGKWYDLTGRRLDGKPARTGIYVKDGRKVLVK